MGDSKPIEIGDNFQSLNCEQNSLSAYASAESSPTSCHDINKKDFRLVDEPCFPQADDKISAINTYWGLPPASSLVIDEEDKLDALEYSREKMSQSKSFYTAKELNSITDDKEYKSLPVQKSEGFVDCNQMDKTIEGSDQNGLKKELSQSDLFKLNVIEDEEDLVNVVLKDDADLKSDQLPEMSIPKSKSSTMAFIESIFGGSIQTEKEVKKEAAAVAAADAAPATTEETQIKHTLTAALTSAATSASSPNPECSPYKFLMNEYSSKSSEQKTVSSLKLSTGECDTTSATNEKATEKCLIENLNSLSQKDSETHDPILSGAAPSQKNDDLKAEASAKPSKSEKQISPKKSISSTKLAANSKSPAKTNSNTLKQGDVKSSKVDQVPASSREFCMDLNFNLASAAAATAGGPVVVVDNTNKSPVAKEHNKFTSNASTSSIHTDLKMILEESKDDKKPNSKENKKLNKSLDVSKKDKPKPQRLKKEKENKENSKHNLSNVSFNSSAAETTTNSMTVETGNMSPTSKTNDLNLIKMMMLMVENNNNMRRGEKLNKKQQKTRNVDRPSLIELAKQDGRYKYSKEFLTQIRDQRAGFIDEIYPDIFKAYCYCMNGKYWDPEKYFDIIQFPGEYDRIPSNRNSYNNRSASYNNKSNSKYNKKYTPNNSQYNSNSNSKSVSLGTTPTAVPHHLQDESPQPLKVPKNSPKLDMHNKENKNKKSPMDSIFESLGLSSERMNKSNLDADKILLGLIKNDKNFNANSNLMDIINKKENSQQQSQSILDNLLPKSADTSKVLNESSSSHKHYPMVLTAQELEMSQMNRHKLPNEISMTKLEEFQLNLNSNMDSNNSFAYKQLVKNLSNHPLNSATALNNKLEASLTKLQNKQKMEHINLAKNSPNWQVSNDGTTMLKQLLNLKTKVSENKTKASQRAKKSNKSSKVSHLSTSSGSVSAPSSAESSPVDSSNKFPLINPHEKPFKTYMAEENRKQIEQVVASALNQVLSKSPSSVRQMSPTMPKSPIEDFIQKMNVQSREQDLKNTQHEHFNSLLNKMNAQQAELKQEQPNILKWFSDAKAPSSKANRYQIPSLTDIEFIQMHRPDALNKLF